MTGRFLLAALFVSATVAPLAAGDDPFRKFLAEHCLDCHGGKAPKAGLDLSALTRDYTDPAVFARWVKVHDRVKAGAMPPKGQDRPGADERQGFLGFLAAGLGRAERARNQSEGRAAFRRLTRTELEYTLRDLFDLPGMPIKDSLPADGTAAGFDKVSEALDVSPVQLARHLDAARAVLDQAIATRPQKPKPFRRRMNPSAEYPYSVCLTNGDCVLLKDKKPDPAFPIAEKGMTNEQILHYVTTVLRESTSSVGVFRHMDESFNPGFWRFSPILPGRYKFRLSVWSFWWDKGEVLPSRKTQVVSVRTQRGLVGHFDAPSLDSEVHEFEAWMEPNDVLLVNAASLEHVHVYNRKGQAKEYQGPGIAVDWLDVEGPVYDSWPPPGHKLVFGDLPIERFARTSPVEVAPARPVLGKDRRRDSVHPNNPLDHGKADGVWMAVSANPAADAARLLKPFLSRAFRRPATDAQVSRYLPLVAERLKLHETFEDAMRSAYAAALCAPEFLFRIERPGKLDDWAVASRLSYLLWDTMPDDELGRLASRGQLAKDRETLRLQVRRMLADPRSERFLADFLGQWLALNDIAATTPDPQLFPEFKPYMQDCLVEETRAYFRQLLDRNLGVRYLVESDFAMLNAELGQLYGIANAPPGHNLRRVSLPNAHRGGLLTQGSVLKVTANGTVTSPVKRGAWVMDRLLGLPPDPPPPNVPAIDPDLRGATTIRQQLDLHRAHASCNACHAKIDPPGFALESYDPIGRWRERYRTKEKGDRVTAFYGEGHYPVNYLLGLRVDSSGRTADGAAFAGIEDFKKLLLRDERQLARNLARRLAVYATGREIGFADRPAIEAILDRCRKAEQANAGAYPLRSLLEEVVLSELFLNK